MSSAKKIINQNTAVLELIKGKRPDGSSFHAYVLFTADVLEIVKEKFGVEEINFSDYGVVLYEGEGEPSEDSKRIALEKLEEMKK